MPQSNDEIVVAGNGQIYVAPLGSTEPTDTTTAWDAAWVDLGFANDDGVTINRDRTIEDVGAWQSFYPVRRMVTEENFTVAFNLLQWNAETVKLAFGGGTITDTAGSAPFTYEPPDPGELDERMLGVEWVDGTKTYRLVVRRAMVTESVETALTKTGASELPITMGVIGEAGVKPYVIISDDPAMAA